MGSFFTKSKDMVIRLYTFLRMGDSMSQKETEKASIPLEMQSCRSSRMDIIEANIRRQMQYTDSQQPMWLKGTLYFDAYRVLRTIHEQDEYLKKIS